MKTNKRLHKANLLLALSFGLMLPLPQSHATSACMYHEYQGQSALWWQWSMSIPTEANPMTDFTGENCMVGQKGDSWYLAGAFFTNSPPATVTRKCSIPQGKALFFPIVNSISIDIPNPCGQGSDRISVADLRKTSAYQINGIVLATALLDGKPIRSVRRVRSPVFAVTLHDRNVFDPLCKAFGLAEVPAGVFSPSVAVEGASQFVFSEKTLNQVAFLLDEPVTITRCKLAAGLWGHSLHTSFLEASAKKT